jgi:hypothetical protein
MTMNTMDDLSLSPPVGPRLKPPEPPRPEQSSTRAKIEQPTLVDSKVIARVYDRRFYARLTAGVLIATASAATFGVALVVGQWWSAVLGFIMSALGMCIGGGLAMGRTADDPTFYISQEKR